jgi:glycosyltransferase involved in cell wall biosynthesis
VKVLFLSNEYGIDRSPSAYTLRLHKLRCALARYGIRTEFLSLREQPVRRPILAQPLNLPFIRKKIADCDFIHAGGNAAYTAAFLKPYTRARLIHDVHGDSLGEAQLKWANRHGLSSAYWVVQALIADAVANRFAEYYLAVSKPLRQRLVDDWRIPSHRIGLIRNGVDLDVFAQPAGHLAEKFTVGYAGGFQPWQGLENLVSAFEILPAGTARLKIIGFTEQHAHLKARILHRLGNKVELVNRVPQTELVSQLGAAQALIIPRPSHRAVEVAFPTKFTEYLALGKPLIVCDVDETARLVREHRCGLVSNPNPLSIAETIRAGSNLTCTELNQMGRNARRLAEQEFSWHHIGRSYADLLTAWSAA